MTPALHLLFAIALSLPGASPAEPDAPTGISASADTVASPYDAPDTRSPAPVEPIEDSDDDQRHAPVSFGVTLAVSLPRALGSARDAHRPGGHPDSVASHAPRGPPLA